MYTVANLSIFSGSIKEVVHRIGAWVVEKKHIYICVTGAHGIVEAQRYSSVMTAHREAGMVVPDGMPLVWVGKALGHKDTQRIYGPDLMMEICKEAQVQGWRVFLYGTTKETLGKLQNNLLRLYPNLNICGIHAPPFGTLTLAQQRMIIKHINGTRSQVVFVGLSTPKQELWMQSMVSKLHANVLVGVGAAFDFVAGTKKQAPHWMRTGGLEWLFRLTQEPKRLSMRYLLSNSMFLWHLLRLSPRSVQKLGLFIAGVALSIHATSLMGAMGVCIIFYFECLYLYRFIRFIFQSASHRWIFLFFSAIATMTYGYLFRYINNLELWVDEIEVIRFSRIPLGSIAHEVMTKHVTVPPLDYWNMWAWNMIVPLFPISIYEFLYRVPYMLFHTLSTILLVIVFWQLLLNKVKWTDGVLLCIGFLLYFFSPLPFVYSYEIRFYAMTLLGAIVTICLFYKNKLFVIPFVPLVLLFCLNSVYHYIILAPFIVKGIYDTSTRKNATILGVCTVFIGILVLPFLYIPNAVTAINPHKTIESGLTWLQSVYFEGHWRSYATYTMLFTLIFLRKKTSLFIAASCVLYVAIMVMLDMKYNYRYFGGKHFIFIIPFCTVLVYEFLSFMKPVRLRMIAACAVIPLFLIPFYRHVYALKSGDILVAKSPIGLKRVFENATEQNIPKIIFAYGDLHDEDVQYNRIGIDWYASLYRAPIVVDSTNVNICEESAKSIRKIVYYFPNSTECERDMNDRREALFDGVMVTSVK